MVEHTVMRFRLVLSDSVCGEMEPLVLSNIRGAGAEASLLDLDWGGVAPFGLDSGGRGFPFSDA